MLIMQILLNMRLLAQISFEIMAYALANECSRVSEG